ncbi:MAG: leucine-rich repeat domain-containing protein [Ruminococcus sp.]|nr:leucine-rich repeat domain-containing protein [Ruminococcus sp.]
MKTSKILCAALAAVMTASTAAGISCSADTLIADEQEKSAEAVSVGEADTKETESGYDELEWEVFKRWYWHHVQNPDEDLYYDADAVRIKITDDGLVYRPMKDGCLVTEYFGYGSDLVIPEEIDGMTVTGFESFENRSNFIELNTLKTLTIEARIKTMPTVFTDCPELTTVKLPDTLERMSEEEDGLDYWCDMCCPFYNCPKLRDVYIPDSLQLVTGEAFRNTEWMNKRESEEKTVVIGESLVSARAASGKVVIPNGVKWLSRGAFCDNNTMTELVIPASVEGDFLSMEWGPELLDKITFKNGSKGFALEIYSGVKKMILPPSITSKGAKAIIGEDPSYVSDYTTYYYYKGTPVDKLLSSKGYDKAKKSVLPGKTKSLSVAAKKNAAKVTWKSVSTATGYQIQVSPDKAFKKGTRTATVDGKTKTSRTFKKLKSGKKYYVRMRTYKTIGGKKYFGNYTKARAVKVK